MNIDDAIERLSNCHPITKEDDEVFKMAVDCMKFTRDFFPLCETPDRMKRAINLLNSLEYAIEAVNHRDGHVYFTMDEGKLKEFSANRERIDLAIENTKKYAKRLKQGF